MKLRAGLTALTLLSIATTSSAAPLCRFVLHVQKPEVKALVGEDAYMQWLTWEQKANLTKYQKSGELVKVTLAPVPKSAVRYEFTQDTPADLLKTFTMDKDTALWPQHPFNTAKTVPFFHAKPTGTLDVYMTSSRSMAMVGKMRGYTIKMATDHPHGPLGEYQPTKTETRDDVLSAMPHSNHIREMDRKMGADDTLIVMGETLTLSEKDSYTGMVIRDIRQMDDGHYYLPAFSIPFVGREIAQINKADFNKFFSEHFGALLGRAKAKLLMRYGLVMETPNPQNMLIQFDRDMKPTGKMVFRDVSDAFFVDAVADGLGFHEQMALDHAREYSPKSELRPRWSNSAWRLDEAGAKSVTREQLEVWGNAHDRAFVDTVQAELGLPEGTLYHERGDYMNGLYLFFKSEAGKKALEAYRLKVSQR